MSNGVDFKKISLENRELLNSALAREAALREELEKVCGDEWRKDKRQIVDLQQRLTVAEQLLREVLESGDWFRSAIEFINGEGLEVRAKIEAALKTVSEKAKSCPNCKVCMGSPSFPENCLINGVKP